ncbi:hypothetical protein SAMN05444158_3151 [Bradyrhizobium canariense]|uniref:Lipoprotein n=1 Tax=Bradyrhizobium canariense TaxID=255045 RepID=A0A1H1UZE5_9BRAD|nr:hypothetical protein SAMN05444158_3151 [Bradyrhizobium canariense]
MKKLILLVAVVSATSLAGCMTRDQQIAAVNTRDDQKCLGFGARPGTDAYVNCRAQLDSARTTADAIEDAAPAPTYSPVPASDAPRIQPVVIPGPRCTSRGC